MRDYVVPVQDIRFVWEQQADLSRIAGLDGYGDCTLENATRLLQSGARFYEEVWAPTNRLADLVGSTLRGGRVVVLDELRDAYHRTMAGGWNVLPHRPAPGSDGIPWLSL